MAQHPDRFSGFGYCSYDGTHQDVDIYRLPDGKYYLMLDHYRSDPFASLEGDDIWVAIESIEEMRKLINGPEINFLPTEDTDVSPKQDGAS